MDSTILIAIIILVCVIAIAFWIIKKFLKALFIGTIALVIMLVIFGFFVYSDSENFKANIITSDSLFLLKNAEIETGFRAKFAQQYSQKKKPYIFNQTELEMFNEFYNDDELGSILGIDYKVFFIKESMFYGIDKVEVDMGAYKANISSLSLIDMIRSPNTLYEFSQAMSEATGEDKNIIMVSLLQQIKDDYEMKGHLFTILFNEKIKRDGALFLIKEIKKQNIDVYPETAVFKAIKLLPITLLDKSFDKLAAEV